MRPIKLLSLSFILFLSVLFGFITKGINIYNNNINNKLNNNEEKLVYNIVTNKKVGIKGIKHIETYDEYLYYVETSSLTDDYDEEFFENNSLILYSTIESSGSILVSITSLELDSENNLIVNVLKNIPKYGTCDLRIHGFIVEYQKLQKPINKIILTTTIKEINLNEFILKDEKSKNDVLNFLKKINNKFEFVDAHIWFQDDIDPIHLTREEIKAYFEKTNNEKVIEYEIDKLNGRLSVFNFAPMVYITFNSFDDKELNKIFNISQIENIGTVILGINHEVTNIISEVIEK